MPVKVRYTNLSPRINGFAVLNAFEESDFESISLKTGAFTRFKAAFTLYFPAN